MQSNATAKGERALSVSLGLRVKDSAGGGKAASGSSKVAAGSVYFARLSAKLSSESKSIIRRLVIQAKGAETGTVVIGYVQGSGTSANDASLSRQRAITVARYLRSVGLNGRIVTQGKGILNVPSDQARRVDVSIRYLT